MSYVLLSDKRLQGRLEQDGREAFLPITPGRLKWHIMHPQNGFCLANGGAVAGRAR